MENAYNIRYLIKEKLYNTDGDIITEHANQYWECITNDKELSKNNRENFILDTYRYLFINKQYSASQFKYIASKLNVLSILFDKLYSKQQLYMNADYIVYKICNLFLIHNYSLSKQVMICLNDIYTELKQIEEINDYDTKIK